MTSWHSVTPCSALSRRSNETVGCNKTVRQAGNLFLGERNEVLYCMLLRTQAVWLSIPTYDFLLQNSRTKIFLSNSRINNRTCTIISSQKVKCFNTKNLYIVVFTLLSIDTEFQRLEPGASSWNHWKENVLALRVCFNVSVFEGSLWGRVVFSYEHLWILF